MLRAQGCTAEVVEQTIRLPGGRVFKRDLFGHLDIVALEPGKPGLLGVQACRTADQSTRLLKIAQEPRAALWLAAGNRIAVVGWAKRGPRGQRKRWTASVTEVGRD